LLRAGDERINLPVSGDLDSVQFTTSLRGIHMKPSTKDELEGKLHETKGTLKEKVGQVTNNPDLETEGQGEKVAGKVQKKVGQIEKVLEK
jgi:uncharacterized protein YjbJ (UPF0337 family)